MTLADDLRTEVVRTFYGKDAPEAIRLVYRPDDAFVKAVVFEHWQFLREFPRWCGTIVARSTDEDVWAYEVDNLHEELVHDPDAGAGHYEIVRNAARENGWSDADLARGPGPKMRRALDDWWDIVRTRPTAEAMAAVHGTEMLADQRLKKHPEFAFQGIVSDAGFAQARPYGEWTRRWLSTTAADTGHAGRAADLVEKLSHDGTTPEQVLATFRRSMGDMRLYFEAIMERRATLLAGARHAA
jgi:pyrroloquinoline quinone (PQQ) biosynthesis protein C